MAARDSKERRDASLLPQCSKWSKSHLAKSILSSCAVEWAFAHTPSNRNRLRSLIGHGVDSLGHRSVSTWPQSSGHGAVLTQALVPDRARSCLGPTFTSGEIGLMRANSLCCPLPAEFVHQLVNPKTSGLLVVPVRF